MTVTPFPKATLVTKQAAAKEPREEKPVATPSAAAGWEQLDALLHAIEGQVTYGLSPISMWLAFADWAAHLGNAPGFRFGLGADALMRIGQFTNAAFDPTQRPVIQPARLDHRFVSQKWQRWPYNLFSQGFLLAEAWWSRATSGPPGIKDSNQRIVSFAARQWLDAFSPSNFAWANPEVVDATLQTGGQNLAAGLQNLLTDMLEATSGRSAQSQYKVGRDLAATPGKVVARNELIELIQYAPSTLQVRPEPVLIVPAWIMKYYILDLSPRNSLIRYLVSQGFTVVAISWRNPGPEMRHTSLDDYRTKGVLAALDAVNSVCGNVPVHGCGYCLGGTLLCIAAAAMARDNDKRLASMTLFAAQTDFTEAGELQLFINEDQVAFLSDVMQVQGTLDSRQMAGAFQLLRSNDLVWSRAIRSYLLGVREMPNDLMAWNADGTRMPARMHAEYLHRLFIHNDLAEGRFPVGGRPVAMENVRAPMFVVATETDHIAPWRSVHKIHLLNGGKLTFVLTSGGHNAGIVSEPGHPNRHFRIAVRPEGGTVLSPDEWLARADRRSGSWWPVWSEWLAQHSGPMREPPPMGSARFPPLENAPGRYVHEA
ncbi:MAG: polyhydroxyalkanoic acid synthase [Acetobacteraceae bacterium]|nr:polyhydroxyalkanoic acid synthase [Acetobacteraceae bacterium]